MLENGPLKMSIKRSMIFYCQTHRIHKGIVTAENSQPISNQKSPHTLSPRKRIADFRCAQGERVCVGLEISDFFEWL